MRIAVVGKCQFSMFSGSQANATLAVAEVFKLQGHEVSIVSVGETTWWDDVNSLKEEWPVVLSSQITTPFDFSIEVGYMVESLEERKKIANKTVVLFRKHAAIDEIEHSLFPTSDRFRCWEGVSEVWASDAFCNSDDVQILETLSRLPVFRVPYVWTPTAVEKHKAEIKSPLWLQLTHTFLEQEENKGKQHPWSVHVAETNTTSTSSCTLPTLIVREAYMSKALPVSKLQVHNGDHVNKSKFFHDNVWRHARVDDLSGSFLGRQRVIDWTFEPMSCVVTHQRFVPFRPMLFDLMWMGIPFVHNSETVRDYGFGIERFYYKDNRITEGVTALANMNADLMARRGYFSLEGLNGLRRSILEKVSPFSSYIQGAWKENLERVFAEKEASAPSEASATSVASAQEKENVLTIGFCDMWDNFQPSYNFFTLLLEAAVAGKMKIRGVGLTKGSTEKPDLIVFGPFGRTWLEFPPTIPKVYFTGENTPKVDYPGVELNLCYAHEDMTNEKYLRLPLWILEIDWFGADPERIVNPKPIPLDRCTKVFPEEMARKKKFCSFIVSNPSNPVRNSAYQWLSQYKSIDSGGALFNNMGDILRAGTGGGGGELKKLEFLKDYKFSITYENSSSPGYVTEKILHAKAAGCIPIYWGDPKINRDFDTAGFICAQNFKSPAELIEAVKKVDEDDALWKKMFSVPALDEYKLEWTRRTMSECARRMLCLATKTNYSVPRFIGAKTSSPLASKEASAPASASKEASVPVPYVVTFTTRRFLPSLQLWLNAMDTQRKGVPDLKGRIYFGEDVPQESIQTVMSTYPWIETALLPVKEVPPHFPDIWEPQHFAWKLWIYKTLADDPRLKGSLIFYSDAGCFMCRWPTAWIQKASVADICFLEDPRQKNEQWCHEVFMRALEVREHEAKAQQIVAGILVFRAGVPRVCSLFDEAWRLGQRKEIIVGEKFRGFLSDGRPCGHRHDQSILSILSMRHGAARFPLDDVYGDVSLRETFNTGKAIYCHRNQFKLNKAFSKGIDDCYIINLDRRADRMERLYKTTPDLKTRAKRFSAIEGKKLQLTPTLAGLFKPHDFMWKKPIMGCALSHLSVWWKLLTEHQDIQTFLVLEDDVKLDPTWETKWLAAEPHLPEDWDVIYLGGILPPNRAGFEQIKERVNEHFSRVAPNSAFGQNPPNRYFHWCAYAYVLSRRGAKKIIDVMASKGGYWTSADHMICNPVNIMNLYFLDPLVAGCYQDDDPRYQQSAFNDFNRVDSFDSDLWNNDERFTEEEIRAAMTLVPPSIGIDKAVQEAAAFSAGANAVVASAPPVAAPAPLAAKAASPHPHPINDAPTRTFKHRIYCLPGHNLDFSQLYEKEWLTELLGNPTGIQIEHVDLTKKMPLDETPIVIVQRPWVSHYTALLQGWSFQGIRFYVLHLSDEHCTDDLALYDLPGCSKVVRMYERADLTEAQRAKSLIIPLGYHWTMRGGGNPMPVERTPRLPFRNFRWSFFGTNWRGRKDALAPLIPFEPNRAKFLESWNDPAMISYDEYIGTLLDTVFVPCPGGNNAETYRFYEALECGCVPIVVREQGDELFVKKITSNMPILAVPSWSEAVMLMRQLYGDKELLEKYRLNILNGWRAWKGRLVGDVKGAFGL